MPDLFSDPFADFCSAIAEGIAVASLVVREAEHDVFTNQADLKVNVPESKLSPSTAQTITIPGAALTPSKALALEKAVVEFDAPFPDTKPSGRRRFGRRREERAHVVLTFGQQTQLESYERVKDALNHQLDKQLQRSLVNA